MSVHSTPTTVTQYL